MIAAVMAAAVVGAPIAYPSFPPGQGFTAVARWLEREAGAPRRDLVAVRDGFAWIMTAEGRDPQAGRPVTLRLETLDAEAWRRLSGRSAIVRLDADCAGRKATIRNADVYQASNLLGGVSRGVAASALPILPDTLAAVADGLCRTGAAPPPTVTEVSTPPTAAAEAPPPPPAEPQGILVAQAPPPLTRLAPTPPPRPAPAPENVTAPRQPAKPPVEAAQAPPPAAPPVSPPMAPPNAAASAPPPRPALTSPSPEIAVQIGAFGSTAAAMVALRELTTAQPKLMAGKLQRLEPIPVAGGQLHRALLTGFSNVAEAEAFCRTLVGGGRPCVVRPYP